MPPLQCQDRTLVTLNRPPPPDYAPSSLGGIGHYCHPAAPLAQGNTLLDSHPGTGYVFSTCLMAGRPFGVQTKAGVGRCGTCSMAQPGQLQQRGPAFSDTALLTPPCMKWMGPTPSLNT